MACGRVLPGHGGSCHTAGLHQVLERGPSPIFLESKVTAQMGTFMMMTGEPQCPTLDGTRGVPDVPISRI